ncbi:MAG: SAM-dependent methyltransferase, partial [Planctomycetota bacterium]
MHPVLIAGAGPGHPGYITVRALEAIRGADVLLYDHLVHPALVAESSESAERISVGKFGGKGGTSQEEILRLLEKKARAGKRVVRLKGGDPLVFGRGGEEAMFCAARGIP